MNEKIIYSSPVTEIVDCRLAFVIAGGDSGTVPDITPGWEIDMEP